jgi:inositol-hexakisphosphate kinase
MLLENLTYNLHRPCVLDLKMGVQQHGDDACEQKRASNILKCAKSTSAKMGVRLVGMQVRVAHMLTRRRAQVYDTEIAAYRCVNKYRGRQLDAAGLGRQLRLFIAGGGDARARIIEALLRRLCALRQVLTDRFLSVRLLRSYKSRSHKDSTAVRCCSSTTHIRMIVTNKHQLVDN